MTAPWTSANGVALPDLVPAALRRRWAGDGYCPDRDLSTLFREQAAAHPDRPAIADAEGAVDYAMLDALALRLAGLLRDAGLGPRDIIGVRIPNGRRAVVAELAVAALGAVALTFPSRGRRDTLALLGRSRASAVLVGREADGHGGAAVARLRPELPHLRHVVAVDDVDRAPAVGLAPFRPVPVDADGPARILVSSGSETEPKMVAYSHNAMAGGRGAYLGALYAGTAVPRSLVLVPLSSSYGSLGTLTLVRHGGTLLLLDGDGAFDAGAAVRALTELRPTHVFGVPTMLGRMAAVPPEPQEDLGALRAIVASGAALPTATLAACLARFRRPVTTVYGSTDGVNCHTTHTTHTAAADDAGRVGRPDPAVTEIRIAPPDGEIQARGPMTPLCYVAAPDLDVRYRTAGGWVRTGDRGVLDTDGTLRVAGRLRRVVSRGGYSISPAEVEECAARHPAVGEAVCVPVPDADLGERLCVCLTPRQGVAPPTLAELNAYLEGDQGLERRKLPERVLTLPSLPLGPTGKVCHRTLTELAAGEYAR